MIINVCYYSRKVPGILAIFQLSFKFHDKFSKKNTQISSFKKIRPVADELFHADGRTKDKHGAILRTYLKKTRWEMIN